MRVIIVSHRTLVVLRMGLPPVGPVIAGRLSEEYLLRDSLGFGA